MVGCQSQEVKTDEPFILSYHHDTINSENEMDVNKWLNKAKSDNEAKIHNFSLGNEYNYFYAKGYSDVLVSYRNDLRIGTPNTILNANFKKGNPEDEVFIEVNYNPLICCNGTVVNDSYKGE
jgi:hypothetical protein